MNISSRKSKGRRLQQLVRDLILQKFNKTLTQADVSSTVMGDLGADVKLSQIARKKFPFSVQCKNQQRLNVWKSLQQCQANAKKDGLKPLLVFKRNRTNVYVTMKVQDFFQIIEDKE